MADQSAVRSTRSDPTAVLREAGETLAQAAYRALRADIIGGTRAPQERLRIEKLKTLYQVGPTPLREALQKLTTEGLVVTEGMRGFAVAPLDLDEFHDLNIARTAIEKEALRLSIAHGDNSWEAQVVSASYLLNKEDAALSAAGEKVPDSWERANAAFHLATVAACGSQWLLRMRENLNVLCERYLRASVYRNIGERDLNAEHNAITEAVIGRDADHACMLVEKHFATTAALLAEGEQTQMRRSLASV